PYPVDIPDGLRDVTVTRNQLSGRFGGSPMEMFPKPKAEDLARHGRDNFLCINPVWNPHAPLRPGHTGLLFVMREIHPIKQALFVRLQLNKWQYMGDYELPSFTPLSAERWLALPQDSKKTWVKSVMKKEWAKPIRARISLRISLGREPMQDEVDGAMERSVKITDKDVAAALNDGSERIRVWTLKCVGYDEELGRICAEISGTRPQSTSRPQRRRSRQG
ncbi:uncharacterized protein BXZ73DRAFT_45411, partial [Epithele typhae]|uniref:uncharacterized protein n=1 Tax=Epithele typhae TaxID=378194 RepID=UPI002007673A